LCTAGYNIVWASKKPTAYSNLMLKSAGYLNPINVPPLDKAKILDGCGRFFGLF
jgi:hypothetical protein